MVGKGKGAWLGDTPCSSQHAGHMTAHMTYHMSAGSLSSAVGLLTIRMPTTLLPVEGDWYVVCTMYYIMLDLASLTILYSLEEYG